MGNAITTPPTRAEMDTMQQIMYRHSISNSTFNGLVYGFFGCLASELTPSVKSGTTIIHSLPGRAIDDKVEMFITTEKTNDDLVYVPELVEAPAGDIAGDRLEMSSYSAGLLVGLATIFPECEFNFYKAVKYIDGEMKNTVVFSVTQGDYPVYFGDLSEAHP